MQISVVVSICHALAGISSPVCHEEIVRPAALIRTRSGPGRLSH